MEVTRRIHVIPVGYEHARVVEPAQEYQADKVILITHSEDDPTGEEYLSKAVEDFDELRMEYEVAECDFFDLYDSIGTLGDIVQEFREDDIYINIATGSKITAVAGFIVATVSGASAYYARAKNYDDGPSGMGDVFELPHYPIRSPNAQQTTVLTILHELDEQDHHPTKGDLIHACEQNGLAFTQKDVSDKGKYRLLDTEVLDPLEEQGYISTYKDGKYRRVELTKDGEGAYQAFKSLIDTESVELGTLRSGF